MRELTSVELQAVSGGATAVEYGLLPIPANSPARAKLMEHFPTTQG
jgi:hypothetical protein